MILPLEDLTTALRRILKRKLGNHVEAVDCLDSRIGPDRIGTLEVTIRLTPQGAFNLGAVLNDKAMQQAEHAAAQAFALRLKNLP